MFLPLWGIYKGKPLSGDLIQQTSGGFLGFPRCVSIHIHCCVDTGVSEKFLHIFRQCTICQKICRVGMTQYMEMKSFQFRNLLRYESADRINRGRSKKASTFLSADKINFSVPFRNGFRRVIIAINVIYTILLRCFFEIAVTVKITVFPDILFLLFPSFLQDFRKCAAKIYRPDLSPLLGPISTRRFFELK